MFNLSCRQYSAKTFSWFLRAFFRLLYNQFAWTYDWVAWIVSLGTWNDWVRSVIAYLQNKPILEIGHGPGHLQLALFDLRIRPTGLDLSPWMGRIAQKRLKRAKSQPALVRGTAAYLPFPEAYFGSIVATFPSEYIADQQTIREIWRVLQMHGRLVILPYAWITGDRWIERLAGWLFQFTGQAPRLDLNKEVPSGFYGEWVQGLINTAQQCGFMVSIEQVNLESSCVLILIADKIDFPSK